MKRVISLAGLFSAIGLSACHTSGPIPATLVDNAPETRSALSVQLGDAVGRAQVDIGPADLTGASSVTVLPPPLSPVETSSAAMPVNFDVMMDGGACYAVHQLTGEMIALNNIACEPAEAE